MSMALSGTALGDELSGASTAKSTTERLIPGGELAQLTINQIIWRSRTLELAVNTVVRASRRTRCSGSTPCIHLM